MCLFGDSSWKSSYSVTLHQKEFVGRYFLGASEVWIPSMDPSRILQHDSWSTVTDALTMSIAYVDCIMPVRNTYIDYFCCNLLVIFPEEKN